LSLDLWRNESQNLIVKNPHGEIIEPKMSRSGERVLINFPAKELGMYRISGNDGKYRKTFAINANPHESDLRLMDHARLPQRANETGKETKTDNEQQRAHFVSGSTDYEAIQSGTDAYHWFVIALCALLFLELILHLVFKRAAG